MRRLRTLSNTKEMHLSHGRVMVTLSLIRILRKKKSVYFVKVKDKEKRYREIITTHPNAFFRLLKKAQLERKDITGSLALSNNSGSVVFETAEKFKIWRQHYSNISTTNNNQLTLDHQEYVIGPPSNISLQDTENALKKFKNRKSPGFSEISIELIRRPIADILTLIFNAIIKCKKIPKDREKSDTGSIHKGEGYAL